MKQMWIIQTGAGKYVRLIKKETLCLYVCKLAHACAVLWQDAMEQFSEGEVTLGHLFCSVRIWSVDLWALTFSLFWTLWSSGHMPECLIIYFFSNVINWRYKSPVRFEVITAVKMSVVHPEDGGVTSLWNVGNYLQHLMALSQPSRPRSAW
jgi:hypothetical protein